MSRRWRLVALALIALAAAHGPIDRQIRHAIGPLCFANEAACSQER